MNKIITAAILMLMAGTSLLRAKQPASSDQQTIQIAPMTAIKRN